MSNQTPPDWPAQIPIGQEEFKNWSWQIDVPNLWTCTPQSADDVVTVCNWAKDHGYQVRPRGIMHGWSPLTIVGTTSPGASLILVDTTRRLTGMRFVPRSGGDAPRVTVGVGATMEQLLTFLEQQPGGQGAAVGYAFPHAPAPGHLTVGGALAINAHGTAIPSPADSFPCSYGSLSNQILAFTAVVTDPQSGTPDRYSLRTFTRGEGDDRAFLAQLGRAFLVDATLQVIDNYNLRCQSFTNIAATTLFAPAPSAVAPPNSMGDFLNRYGRVEAIWFPFSSNPWLKVWSSEPSKPGPSRAVDGPYNYPFSDNLPNEVTNLIKAIINGATWLTPSFSQLMASVTSLGLDLSSARDLWGPSKDTLLYVKDTTLRVTANGYAVQMKKQDVQQAIHDFTAKFSGMLAAYQAAGHYPVNSPLEIRITSLDDPRLIATPERDTARSPVISSLSYDETAIANGWDVALWLDVLTLPGTATANQFYEELEDWTVRTFSGGYARAMPEWSKGWAFTSQGAWENAAFLQHVRELFTDGRSADNTWQYEADTLQRYDRYHLFSNPFLDQLFGYAPGAHGG